MRIIIPIIFLALMLNADCTAQKEPETVDLYGTYEEYKEQTIKDRRFKHRDIVPLIERLKAPFKVEEAGKSIEGREIYKVSIGNGPEKVLLWSQMHGDEPTATMALMDIFNFFSASDELNPWREKILEKLTLIFIPMLNPDGAEVYQRQNALGIDLNRDALRLQTPEAQILKQVRDEVDADWGFNLHDQPTHIGAGMDKDLATISFLAPAYNYEKEVNEVRGNAMKMIVHMNEVIQEHLPGNVARYSDAFEPRAFGDNIQKWGTSTILIESGGLEGDPEKQMIRKINYVSLMSAFEAIAEGVYTEIDIADYEKIPMNNRSQFYELLLREVQVEMEGNWYTVDLGFNKNEITFNRYRDYYLRSYIADVGDLSIFYGYEEFDGQGYQAQLGEIYGEVITPDGLKEIDVLQLLKDGYTAIRMTEMPGKIKNRRQLPINLLKMDEQPSTEIFPGRNPSILLKKGGEARYVIMNGQLHDLSDEQRIRELMQTVME